MFSLKDVIEKEREQLRIRREKLGLEKGTPNQENWFGIALSGGGIRSATINLGFLKTLNRFGILQKADYLSTVSGGGYTHAYVQSTVKNAGDFSKLFTNEHINSMRQHGEYLIPGKGFMKTFNGITLLIAFLASWVMTLISPFIVFGIIYHLYVIVMSLIGENPLGHLGFLTQHDFWWWATRVVGGVMGLHFLSNVVLNFNLGISKIFNRVEVLIMLVFLSLYLWIVITGLTGKASLSSDELTNYCLNTIILILVGFLANPNALSLHRYYRKQLADLFLVFSGEHANRPLNTMFNAYSDKKEDYIAPYPLINTCLNLLNPDGDPVFKGSKTSDYFLLSPLFFGSKLIKYVSSDRYSDYRRMTLPAAVTISAAAVNPGMGMYSSRILSVLMTIFNARLGFWISNPYKFDRKQPIVWWPLYFFRELMGKIGSTNTMINISDGGHIENLGVYELLRRKCRLILCFDAGEDRLYSFSDLNNLLIRARNELGIEIRFREGEQPEELLRPRPTQVYSKRRYAIADIFEIWNDEKDPVTGASNIINHAEPIKIGTFIYAKSTVTAPVGKPDLDPDDRLKYGTYKYKIYHPEFPHESTSDQFFDEIQWEAYFQLGQYVAAEMLKVPDLSKYDSEPAPDIAVYQLLDLFDRNQPPIASKSDGGFKPKSSTDDNDGFEVSSGDEDKSVRSVKTPEAAPEVKYSI